LTAGTVKLIGTNRERVYGAAKILLTDATEYKKMAESLSPYGDGHAAERIVKALLWRHKFLTERPEEFI
jgi:UDP-N-acetylglucosamine 2-epimerase (non-hydrolysing)